MMTATTVDQWLEAMLAADVADMRAIAIRALEADGIAREHIKCDRHPDVIGLTFTGAVRHLLGTETQHRAEHDGQPLHQVGDLHSVPFGTQQRPTAAFWSTSPCKSCRQPIIWAVTSKGSRMPVNVDPDPAGNVVLSQQTSPTDPPLATVIGAHQLDQVPRDSLHTTHFQTCPRADAHRTKGKR